MNKFLLQVDLTSYHLLERINFPDCPLIRKIENSESSLFLYGSYSKNINVDQLFDNLNTSQEIENVLKRLDGDYLLIFISPKHKKIILANDKNAKYRLYYSIEDHLLTISNQTFLHAAYMLEPQLSQRGLLQILTSNYLFDPQTLLQKVSVIPAGGYVIIDRKEVKRDYYHKTVQYHVPEYESKEKTILELDNSLNEVFEKRKKGRGEPFVLLSGGIDSLAMVHYLKSGNSSQTNSLTFGLKGTENDDQRASRKATSYFGLSHHELRIDPSDSWDLLVKGLYKSDAFTYSTILTTAIRDYFGNDTKYVLFSGQDTRLHTPGLDFGSIIGIKRNILNEPLNIT